MTHLRKFAGGLIVAVLLAFAPSAFGQAVYGSVFGTVTDPTGAVVPNATITITDVGKGTSSSVQANASGDFTIEHLIPDVYNIKIDAPGFRSEETNGVRVSADTSVKVPGTLSLGDTGTVVEVNADAVPQLKADRADVSTIFGAKEIQDLPLGDRNFTNLQLLLPGAQRLGWSHAASENPQGSAQIQVDGQAFGGVAFELDGTDNQDPILGIIVINPNIDSLAESKITTQNYDAEFGKAVASVVTAQTKSGSNKFHGSLFDYRQSNANLARDPFTQGPNQLSASNPFPKGLKNTFGGSIGGRIITDRLFFFGDYQGVRQKTGISELQTVPTAKLVSSCLTGPYCDFSEYKTAGITIYKPGVFVPGPGGKPMAVPYGPNGDQIPHADLSPQALALFKLLQPYTPNSASDLVNGVGGLRNNFAGSGQGGFNSNQYDVRVDFQASERVHAFGRFSRFTDTLTGTTIFGSAGGSGFGLGGYAGNSRGANDSVALGTDVVINPKLVADFRIGYYRYNINNSKFDAGVPFATQLGIPGENLGDVTTSGAPLFNLTEVGTADIDPNNSQSKGPQYGGGLNVTRCNCPLKEKEDQLQGVANITKTIGNHNLKIGADIRYARNLRVPSDNDRTGINNFGREPTSDGARNGGLGFATFLLGDVTSFNRYVSTSTNAKEFQKRDFFYAQDTWRATPKLTLNYGLRYDIYFPEAINTKGQGAVLNLDTGYLQVAGVGGVASNMNFSRPAVPIEPRVGVAYQVTPKTVIRGGYGRSFDIGVFGSIFGHVATQNLPVLANQQFNNGGANSQSFAFNLAQGPGAPTFTPVPASGLLPNPGYAVTSKARTNVIRLPTLDAWNLSLQQSLTSSLSMTIAYVGNKGTHTLSSGDGNNTNPNEAAIYLPAQFSAIPGQALRFDPNGGNCYPLGVNCTITGAGTTGKLIQNGITSSSTFLKRYYGGALAACSDPNYARQPGVPVGSCGWNNDIQYYGDNQDTHYNALQAGLTKTFTRGLSFNANYAWQQSINFNNSFATWDKLATRGRDEALRQQQVTVYGLYQLPFGRNQLFFSHVNGFVNAIIGGLQLSPVVTYASGLPFTLTPPSCPGTPGDVPCYLNGKGFTLHRNVHGTPGNGLSFYDAIDPTKPNGAALSVPGTDQIGNLGRDSAFGPRFFTSDLALQKDFAIRERLTAQLRVDAFNAFNHINYGNPGGNIANGGSITSGPGIAGSATPRQLQFSGRFQF